MIGYVIYPLREIRAELKGIFDDLADPDEVPEQWLDDTLYELVYTRFFGPNAKYSEHSVYDRLAGIGVDDASTQINVVDYAQSVLSTVIDPVYRTYFGHAFIKFSIDSSKLVYEINPFHERTSPSYSFQAAPQGVG